MVAGEERGWKRAAGGETHRRSSCAAARGVERDDYDYEYVRFCSLLYGAAKFAVGLSSLGVVNISGFFLRGPPPPTPQSVIKWQLANPPSFWLSNGPNKFTNPNPAKSHISQNRQRAARAGGLWPSPAAPGRRCVYSGGWLAVGGACGGPPLAWQR